MKFKDLKIKTKTHKYDDNIQNNGTYITSDSWNRTDNTYADNNVCVVGGRFKRINRSHQETKK